MSHLFSNPLPISWEVRLYLLQVLRYRLGYPSGTLFRCAEEGADAQVGIFPRRGQGTTLLGILHFDNHDLEASSERWVLEVAFEQKKFARTLAVQLGEQFHVAVAIVPKPDELPTETY